VNLDNLKSEDIEEDPDLTNDPVKREAHIQTVLKNKPKSITGNTFYTAVGGLVCRTCGLETNLCKCPKTQAEAEQISKKTGQPPAEIKNDTIKDKARFIELIQNLRVMARSQPIHKYALVLGLKELNKIVAVTGDGTNDAPALSKSDVGFAMFAGTDIAKEASDIIIIDNNFSSIVVAIIYGRNIYDNIRKFLQFQLTVNFCACLLVFICACIGNDSPLTTIQMLWINLIMDSLGSLALATESPYDELLDREPTKRDESIINGKMWKHIAIQSLVELILLLILYLRAPHFIKENDMVRLAENNIIKYCYGEMPGNISEKNIIFGTETKWGSKVKLRGGMTEEDCGKYAEKQDLSVAFELYINVNGATTHMTLLFNIFVIYTLFNQINCRVIDDSFNIFVRIKKNFFFPCITLGELVLQILLVQFGKEAFKVTERGLSFKQWLISIGFSLITFALSASIKRIPLDEIIQKFLDKNVKNNKIANIDDLVINNGSTINIGNSNYVEKNDINLSIDKETNNTVKRDDSRKKSESFIQKNLMKRRSISKGGSLRANKADVNFSNNN
jgi:Ca2+ transporting ATPase